MKRIAFMICFVFFLSGCHSNDASMTRAMDLRAKLMAHSISFDTAITADYGQHSLTFQVSCEVDSQGKLNFTVNKPDSISGVSGTIQANGGKLTFDSQAVAFELLADGQLSPASGPWILINTLRCGYLTSCGVEGDCLRLSIDDSYEEDALHMDIWLDGSDNPIRGEVLWQGRRILSMDVTNFRFL